MKKLQSKEKTDMKREHIESLAELCRKWLKLDNAIKIKDKHFLNSIEFEFEEIKWEFEELDEEYVNKTKQNVEKDIFEIVEKLCRK